MSVINLLDRNTIDQIAAGEVVDRPASVVKELLENAIDAKANAITVEIREGGISLIRITDNGEGIAKNDIKKAFLRHATSKISSAKDLLSVHSLGFRGEALSSIAAVAQVECISKPGRELVGSRYVIEGGEEKVLEDVGAPAGTTFIVKNLFYNTPARKKFLKTPATEASYISSIIEKIAFSHPEISIRFIVNSQTKLHTSGNGKLKDIIYTVLGRDICANMMEISKNENDLALTGYIGKPMIVRGNRNQMICFINGRYIKSKILYSAIEEAYKPYIMPHNYPFCILNFEIDSARIDVNVHPSKMELRFDDQIGVFNFFYETLRDRLAQKELIPEVKVSSNTSAGNLPSKTNEALKTGAEDLKTGVEESPTVDHLIIAEEPSRYQTEKAKRPPEPFEINRIKEAADNNTAGEKTAGMPAEEQLSLFDGRFISKSERSKHKLIGQLFGTYWLIEYEDHLYIIDQHAAHEKVLYEQLMKRLKDKTFTSQQINPPIILTLSMAEEELLLRLMDHFTELGYEIEAFGGREYAVRAVPDNLYGLNSEALLRSLIDNLNEDSGYLKSGMITEKIASMSCKAAVKGNHVLSEREADALIGQLLELENPYNCPHGRPTIISMSKYEIEKKFKRIL